MLRAASDELRAGEQQQASARVNKQQTNKRRVERFLLKGKPSDYRRTIGDVC
jgi:hypothetical protein